MSSTSRLPSLLSCRNAYEAIFTTLATMSAAVTLEECWELVNTSEQTRRHCVMLENCCYGYNEMMVLNMVKAGLFGELTHGAAAYNHDLRSILASYKGEGLWRRAPHNSSSTSPTT